jgi:hypothetical protein
MNPFDFTKPPPGTPDDPMAMGMALQKRSIVDIFNAAPDVPPSDDAGAMFAPDTGEQLLSYNPDQYSIAYDDSGSSGAESSAPPVEESDDALEQAYLQRAMQERDTSVQAQDQAASVNMEEDQASRRKMGL